MYPNEKDRVTAFALYAPCIALADAVRELVDWECVQNIAEALAEAREEGRVEGRVEGRNETRLAAENAEKQMYALEESRKQKYAAFLERERIENELPFTPSQMR